MFMPAGIAQLQRRHDAGGGPAIYFQDEFVDANNTDITAHTPDVGTGWTEVVAGSNPAIINNRLDSWGTCEWRCDGTSANCTIHATVYKAGAQQSVGIRFRGTSSSSFATSYLLWFDDSQVILYKGLTYFAQVWNAANNNVTRTVRIELNGTSIKIYIDGSLRYSVTESYAQTGIYHGFRFYQSTGQYIERFQVEEYNAL